MKDRSLFHHDRPWIDLGVTLGEWHALTEWAEDVQGHRLSRQEVYYVGLSLWGRGFVMRHRAWNRVVATGIPQACDDVWTRLVAWWLLLRVKRH